MANKSTEVGQQERESLDQIFKMLMRKDKSNPRVRSGDRGPHDLVARFYDGETEYYL